MDFRLEKSRLQAQIKDLELELGDLRKERNEFQENLALSRESVAKLTSLSEAQASKIRDLERELERVQRRHVQGGICACMVDEKTEKKQSLVSTTKELKNEDDDIVILSENPYARAPSPPPQPSAAGELEEAPMYVEDSRRQKRIRTSTNGSLIPQTSQGSSPVIEEVSRESKRPRLSTGSPYSPYSTSVQVAPAIPAPTQKNSATTLGLPSPEPSPIIACFKPNMQPSSPSPECPIQLQLPDSLWHFLETTPAFAIDRCDISTSTPSRIALCDWFGGSRGAVAFTRAKRNYTHLFISHENSPILPNGPGRPSFVLAPPVPCRGDVRVFVRRGHGDHWAYGGEYRCTTRTLSLDELFGLPLNFLRDFVKSVLHEKREEEIHHYRNAEYFPSLSIKKGHELTVDEALRVFENGSE
ncbi:hypothetical protein H0H81_004083, partial [Sphagnurus paluster]